MRDASRGQARDIMVKLDRIGCSVEPGPPAAPFTFSSAELDLLAQEEHLRWVSERTAAGWVPGPARDDARKVHPSLVGWDSLDEIERDKDRDAVRHPGGARRGRPARRPRSSDRTQLTVAVVKVSGRVGCPPAPGNAPSSPPAATALTTSSPVTTCPKIP